MQQSNEKHVLAPIGGALALLVIGGLFFLIATKVNEIRQERAAAEQRRLAAEQLNAEIQQAKTKMVSILRDRHQDDWECSDLDPWGTKYEVKVIENKENTVALTDYRVLSAGPDKEFGTDDDLISNNSDMNWTKTGEAIGNRTGRATRGFIKGLWNSDDGK